MVIVHFKEINDPVWIDKSGDVIKCLQVWRMWFLLTWERRGCGRESVCDKLSCYYFNGLQTPPPGPKEMDGNSSWYLF